MTALFFALTPVEGWELIGLLVLAGTVLMIVEMFVPGMVLGTIGAILLVASVVVAFRQMGPQIGAAVLATEAVGVCLAVALWLKYFHLTPIARAMIVPEAVAGTSAPEDFSALLDTEGTTTTVCRPSGVAQLLNRRFDVITEGAFLDEGQSVRVIRVEGSRIVVRAV